MGITSWFNYQPNELDKLIELTIKDVKNWRVAVLYGPTSEEDKLYMTNKPRADWSVYDVLNGLWKLGIDAVWLDPTQSDFFERVREFDAAFINVHGEFGEDGNLQGLLAYLGVPYTGSGVSSSAIAADKRLTKLVLAESEVQIPDYQRILISEQNSLPEIEIPFILKAVNGGSSVGMELITDTNEFSDAINRLKNGGFVDLISESFIEGMAITVPAIRIKSEIVLLPPIACITDNAYYDKDSKLFGDQNDLVEYQIMTDLTDKRIYQLHDEVKKILETLDFDGSLRADFIIGEKGELAFLEINTIPGVQHGSNLVLSAEAAKIDYSSLLGVILASAKNTDKLAKWTLKELVK